MENDPLDILDQHAEPKVRCETCGHDVPKSEWESCTRRKLTEKVKNLNPFKKSRYTNLFTKIAKCKN
ncbi:MAG TPA: hypothetical protein VMW10_10820 [Alphaproteobacteria bacterium]|nr:hypothetical protein [Alphaproteobacteria bacterium]